MWGRAYGVGIFFSTQHAFVSDRARRFDESEDRDHPRMVEYPVRFRGNLEIQSLSWLTPIGRDLIDTELRQRDAAQKIHASRNQRGPITLEILYYRNAFGTNVKISVTVQCDKSNSGVLYCCCRCIPFTSSVHVDACHVSTTRT